MKHKPLHNGDLRAMERDPKLRLYRKYLRRLERYVEDGSFWRFSIRKRKTLVNRLKRLWNQLMSWQVPLGKLAVGSALLAALGLGNTQAQTLTFVEQTGIDNPIDSTFNGYFTTPGLVDIDGDGDLDAFVGHYQSASTLAEMRFFENQGSATAPMMVEQIGTTNPLDGETFTYIGTPNFVDIDNDGDQDVFFGTVDFYGNNPVRFFENQGTSTIPNFVEQIGASNPFNSLTSVFAFPTFMDLDNDGDFDAFVAEYAYGSYGAVMNYYENTGTNAAPIFTLQSPANNPLSTLSGNYIYFPTVTDVDNDGDFDFFVGDYGSYGTILRYFENTGNATVPSYTEKTGIDNPFSSIVFGYYGAVPTFADIDGDGDQDAFIGHYDDIIFEGRVRYFENTTDFTPVPINPGEVVLNEFLALNVNNEPDQDGEFDPWIELYNNTGNPINLEDAYLTDDINIPTKWAFPKISIPANDFIIVWADGDNAQAGLHTNFDLLPGPGFLMLANGDSSVIDSVSFGVNYPDITTGRDPNGMGAFTYMPPTFSDTNAVFSISPGMLTINEFQADNESTVADQDGEFDDWIELHNNTGIDLDLRGLFLSDDTADPTKWQFPDTTIASNDFLIIWADNDSSQTGLHAGFALAAGGEEVILSYPEGTILDATNFGQQFRDLSTSRIPNGNGPFDITPATFSDTNAVFSLRAGDLVINEFIANNTSTQADSAGEFDDWIELFNTTNEDLDLNGVFLSNDAGNATLFQLPKTTLPGGEYLIVWADMDDTQAGIHANFTLDENTGGVLRMNYPKVPLDSAVFSAQNADESFGRFPNGTGPFNFMPATYAAENTFFTNIEGELGQVSVNLYPNPAKDRLVLELSEPVDVSIQLVNVVGQTLMEWQIGLENKLEMNISSVPTGVYFLRIGRSTTKRLIIQK